MFEDDEVGDSEPHSFFLLLDFSSTFGLYDAVHPKYFKGGWNDYSSVCSSVSARPATGAEKHAAANEASILGGEGRDNCITAAYRIRADGGGGDECLTASNGDQSRRILLPARSPDDEDDTSAPSAVVCSLSLLTT
eukprot:CAMPEP_0172554948 /NCGR_PEP_ID=MMETSP1067-20121228/57207_1 /TAXON_ID=265564 ORGANISM="Thalassiosira punctigera, Strain Tpunct2005C2" /NCGR_SAMPLE_ID=MMETSP1067 /ASSEMBLY_ACC=CAM_ASM_000444 /LENGTH=135 /DNA_ID=CAMNT_0013343429 /DNA_START=44 /DNA_END=453 /DNA_ORIENTATION=+